jgi:hypothetical protein
LVLFVIISILLVSCDISETLVTSPTDESTDTRVPVQPTDKPASLRSTAAPTATAIPPTETPAPTKDLPEVPFMTFEDLLGTWKPENSGFYRVNYQVDGMAQLIDSNGQAPDTGVCSFDRDVVPCSSEPSLRYDRNTEPSIISTCIGTYNILITNDGDIPVRLKYHFVEDENDMRAGILTLELWVQAEESHFSKDFLFGDMYKSGRAGQCLYVFRDKSNHHLVQIGLQSGGKGVCTCIFGESEIRFIDKSDFCERRLITERSLILKAKKQIQGSVGLGEAI